MWLAAGENFSFFASFLRFSFGFCSRFLRILRCLPQMFLGEGASPPPNFPVSGPTFLWIPLPQLPKKNYNLSASTDFL